MDPYNPFIAETHVKNVPFWQVAAAMAVGVLVALLFGWAGAVILLSLDRVAS